MNDKVWASALLLALSSNAVLLAILTFVPLHSPSSQIVPHHPSEPRPEVGSSRWRRSSEGGVPKQPSDMGWLHMNARFRMGPPVDSDQDEMSFRTRKLKADTSDSEGYDDVSIHTDGGETMVIDGLNGRSAVKSHPTVDSDVLYYFKEFLRDPEILKELLTGFLPRISEILRALKMTDKTSSGFANGQDIFNDIYMLKKLISEIINGGIHEENPSKQLNSDHLSSSTFSKLATSNDRDTAYADDSNSFGTKRFRREVKSTTTRKPRKKVNATTSMTSKKTKRNTSAFVADGPPWGNGVPTKINYIHAKPEQYGMEPVFSAFTKQMVRRMSRSIEETMLPALIHFEAIVFRHLDGLHSALVNQELRLGSVEKVMTSLDEDSSSPEELQADAQDNKTEMKDIDDVISEGFQLYGNFSGIVEVIGDGSGSVDEWTLPTTTTAQPTTTTTSTTPETTTMTTTTTPEPTTTTTTTTTTTIPTTTPLSMNPVFIEQMREDIFNISYKVANINHHLDDLRNHKMMTEAELSSMRSEVINMDDKVTEVERKQRNMRVRTTMQNYKLTELDMYMGRTELTMQATLGTFQRMNERFDNFKDKMSDFKDEVHKMTSAFSTQRQISEELRSADSYKAHDIQDIRKTIMQMQSQFNDLYRLVDDGAMNVRNEVMHSVERLCSLNDLVC